VAQLFWVAGDHGAAPALEHGQGGGDVALGGLVDDDQVEGRRLEGQDAMSVGQVDQPDRQGAEHARERDPRKILLLARAGARAHGAGIGLQSGAVGGEQFGQVVAPAFAEQFDGERVFAIDFRFEGGGFFPQRRAACEHAAQQSGAQRGGDA